MRSMITYLGTWDEEDVLFLSQLGIDVKAERQKFILEESDERLVKIREYFANKDCIRHDIRRNILWREMSWKEYSKEDMEAAEYYVLKGHNHSGYPQPENSWEEVLFDKDSLCPKCKCGRVQVQDLRVKRVSKHGFWGYCAWLGDEMFVSRKVYEEVFAPYGIGKRTIVKGGKPVEDVYQLLIPVTDEPLDLSERVYEVCPICGEVKYSPALHKYPFFPLHKNPLPGIYKTLEYFGGGWETNHKIILSRDVVDKLIKSKDLAWYMLVPCKRM